MGILFFSDPHLGLSRSSNVTAKSAKALSEKMVTACAEAIGKAEHGDTVVCAGDLFDKYSNPEHVIAGALKLIDGKVDMVVAGNHDVSNDTSKVGSLDLLAEVTDVVLKGNVEARLSHCGQCCLVAVPHCLSQGEFDNALSIAAEMTANAGGTPTALILHCNYDIPFEGADSTLNLSSEKAEELLRVFDYILIGHDHNPREYFDGRLIIIGNTHPTGFSDISDKRVVRIEDGVITSIPVWSMATGYAEVDHKELSSFDATGVEFIRVTGTATRHELAGASKAVAKLWKDNDGLLAVKMDVAVECSDIDVAERKAAVPLKERIAESLKGDKRLLELWNEVSV